MISLLITGKDSYLVLTFEIMSEVYISIVIVFLRQGLTSLSMKRH